MLGDILKKKKLAEDASTRLRVNYGNKLWVKKWYIFTPFWQENPNDRTTICQIKRKRKRKCLLGVAL